MNINAKILGRFNYLTVKKDEYSVIFNPFDDLGVAVKIATKLTYYEAIDLQNDLNAALENSSFDFYGLPLKEIEK